MSQAEIPLSERDEAESGLAKVLEAEITAIGNRRERLGVPSDLPSGTGNPGAPPPTLDACLRDLNRNGAFGLALSGGGIRSATFSLGVIQALAEERMLRFVDYLSTVSGGGYIGSWLLKQFRTRALDAQTFHALQEQLQPPVSERSSGARPAGARDEDHAIGWLRQFSNYLAPRVGVFSADVWSIATIWIRNTLLNQLILVAIIGAILCVPHILVQWMGAWEVPNESVYPHFLIATVVFLLAVVVLSLREWVGKYFTQGTAAAIAVILYAAAYLTAIAVVHVPPQEVEPLQRNTFLVMWIGSSIAALSNLVSFRKLTANALGRTLMATIAAVIVSFAATWVFSFGLHWTRILHTNVLTDPDYRMVLAPSAILILFGVQVVIVFGLLGRFVKDFTREWWARVGAWLCIVALALGLLSLAALRIDEWVKWLKHLNLGIPAIVTWLLANYFGVSSSASSRTRGENGHQSGGSKAREIAASLAPLVFSVGLILLVAWGVWLTFHTIDAGTSESTVSWATGREATHAAVAFVVMLFLLVLATMLSLRVDVNEFSMHNFYRNRLVRCYLGSSNPERQEVANPLTNFCDDDDLPLASLGNPNWKPSDGDKKLLPGATYLGPVPIINTAVNLATIEPGKAERRADSFIFTPYHCGYFRDKNSFRPTAGITQKDASYYLSEAGGITLGHAFTVSGAAASPNMGYHTSGPVALLMTVFNVRLGWWFPNPRKNRWMSFGPRVGALPLIQELFALASAERSFVYVSDGGHFENLAVYELLRRRCRFIVCCDAEQDQDFTFGGLGGLVRKARADFGIEIDIDPAAIANRDEKGYSKAHCAVATINYPEPGLSGILVYLKSSVVGDEPADILQYRATDKNFPHQTTGDQFFSESQFESYRRLGYHVAMNALEPIRRQGGKLPHETDGTSPVVSGAGKPAPATAATLKMHETFAALRQAWGAAPRYDIRDFTALTAKFDSIMERLRQTPELAFLIAEFYVQLSQIPSAGASSSSHLGSLLKDEGRWRIAFLFCNSLVQLMEDAYAALDLEQNFRHPDAHGWMNLFRHWSWSPTFRLTYAVSAPTFGARFQSFAKRHLDLSAGELTVAKAAKLSDTFNHYERSLLGEMNRQPAPEIYAIRVRPNLQIPPDEPPEAQVEVALTIGFAIVDSRKNALNWIRIQDHLRRMGYGREALRLLRETAGVTDFQPFDPPPESWQETDCRAHVEWVRAAIPWEDAAPSEAEEPGASAEPSPVA